ncbi:MAG: futalosine hydrolase, partial [Desulfohalobiaceae bacterium]
GFSQGSLQGRPVFERLALHPQTSSATLGVSLSSDWLMATSLSVAGVTGTPELAKTRQKLNADLENMEGFALGWTALRFGIPFLEIRTVSNRVGSRHKDDWDLKSSLAELGHVFSRIFMTTDGR